MIALETGHRQVLSELSALFGYRPVVLVGGGALAVWERLSGRATEDLDVLVFAPIARAAETLANDSRWIRDKTNEIRWRHQSGQRVDVIAASDAALKAGELIAHESGAVFNLAGACCAIQTAVPIDEHEPSVRVARLPALALLKMVAYLDRPAERLKDLGDLAYLLDEYIDRDDDRHYEGEVVELDVDDANAFLLGHDIAAIVDVRAGKCVRDFVARVRDPDDRHSTQTRMALRAPRAWQDDIDVVLRRMSAFEHGLLSGDPAGTSLRHGG